MNELPQVPDFELLREIGRGGFGQVWLAKNRATGHFRAVKLIPLRHVGGGDPAGREIGSITRLEANLGDKHPHLLDIHHVGKTDEHLFYVMPLADDVQGRDVETDSDYQPNTLERQLSDGPLEPDVCHDLTRQLLSGLACLHEAGMVHRDVKPANCLFVDGELKVADFGLVTDAGPQVSRVGTQTYMPPDGRMDTRADVYAAGLVIYEMLTGLPAERFPSLGPRAEELTTDALLVRLNQLVLRACQHDRADRFHHAQRMLEALDRTDGSDGRTLCSRRRAMVAVVGVLAVVGVAYQFWPETESPTTIPVEQVDVSFITEPYEATITLDGRIQRTPDGKEYRTPCTIPGLPGREHHAVFGIDGQEPVDAGRIDFAEHREVVARF